MSIGTFHELEERLASFVVRDAPAVSPEELQQAARHVADLIGVALAGAGLPDTRRLRVLTAEAPARMAGAARVWGTRHWAPLREAGLLNAYAGHVHDFDDDEIEYSMAHVTVTAATAAIVCADSRPGISGHEVLVAYLLGTEVAFRVGEIINPYHYRRGWHASATLGTFAACAAAGRLLGLSVAQMRHAFGICASLASGLRANFGSEAKPLQVGQSVRNGIFAAEAAMAGMTASAGSLFGPSGYASLFEQDRDMATIIAGFGRPYRFLGGSMAIKAYPCCTATHTAIYSMLALRSEHRFSSEEIASIVCHLDPAQPAILIYDRPVDGTQAKFSMQYCLSAAATFGAVGIKEFEEAAVNDPSVRDLMERVEIVPDPGVPKGPSGASNASTLQVALKNGAMFDRFQECVPGSLGQSLSDEDLHDKFVECVGDAKPADASRVFHLLIQAGSHPSFSGLLDHLPSNVRMH
ncbi:MULTISPECIES: MmgE/PrpD family protein [unclassified Sphingobium]|uniref:MmgE/PrpD family protein n=1 Tax=unclassified Sphingobium TaxID=2611147 RepID=UPI0035A6C59A